MRITLLLVAFAFAAGAAQAQIKCWTGADGKRACGDTPPPGAKVTTVRTESGPAPAPSPASKDAKAAPKGPLTPAQQEQEYRKRQAEAQKASAKADQEQKDAQTKIENCNRARAALRTLETGERVVTTDAKGERYYLNDAEIAKQTAVAREQVSQSCN
jgi:glucan-binding YG repeat protein